MQSLLVLSENKVSFGKSTLILCYSTRLVHCAARLRNTVTHGQAGIFTCSSFRGR